MFPPLLANISRPRKLYIKDYFTYAIWIWVVTCSIIHGLTVRREIQTEQIIQLKYIMHIKSNSLKSVQISLKSLAELIEECISGPGFYGWIRRTSYRLLYCGPLSLSANTAHRSEAMQYQSRHTFHNPLYCTSLVLNKSLLRVPLVNWVRAFIQL
jgi:hypothetical protein